MKKVIPPNLDPMVIFLTCVDSFSRQELQKIFYDSIFEFMEMYENFETMANNINLRNLPVDYVPTTVTKDQWIKLYDEKLVQSKNARPLYDMIKTSSPNSKCPLCGSGPVSQVDHHLPKTRYPLLSVALLNLFPICTTCNWNKSNSIPTSQEEEPLHPYFDNIDSEEWLIASITRENPLSFTFSVQQPPAWNSILFKRVENHFVKLKLGPLFAVEAADEFTSRYAALKKLFEAAGEESFREQLKDSFESNSIIYLNSWRTAMYKALWKDDWICQGGLFK